MARWLVGIVTIGVAAWLWLNHQYVTDFIHYTQYTPTAAVSQVTKQARLSGEGTFLFYASQPEVADSNAFNTRCERKEADSPILGCYAAGRIYIYDVTNKQLDGLQAVTAAHEMLHAAYERLSSSERDRLKPLLEAAYQRLKTSELEKRMAYYGKNEPGEEVNELHSIIGTEFTNIGGELERYYEKYFTNRASLVNLHSSVKAIFSSLSSKADDLVKQANALVLSINAATKTYNANVKVLNQDIQAFNARAERLGGFASQAEFNSVRAELLARSNQLEAMRSQIKTDISTYDTIVAQLEAVNTETAALNQSIDSTLSTAPTL